MSQRVAVAYVQWGQVLRAVEAGLESRTESDSMRQAILIPAITLMVSWLSLSTPLSCHHGATVLLHVIQHADHDHVHEHHLVGGEQTILLPARMAFYVYGLSMNISMMSAGTEHRGNSRSTMSSPEASADLVTVRQIPDTALVFPILNPALAARPAGHVPAPETVPTAWAGPGIDPPPRYIA